MSETTGFVPKKGSDPIYILHIEDNEMVRVAMEKLLRRRFGAKVIPAKSGREAMDIIGTHDWSVVLSDWTVEEAMTGGDIFNAVMATRPELFSRYIFMSSDDNAMKLCDELRLPFLMKPAQPSAIFEVVQNIIAPAAPVPTTELNDGWVLQG